MIKPAALILWSVGSCGIPSWSTRTRSLALMRAKCLAYGSISIVLATRATSSSHGGHILSQNSSGFTGSRRLTWPEAPSAQPRRAKVRKTADICCLAHLRSSTLSVKVGTTCNPFGASPELTFQFKTPSEDGFGAVALGAPMVAVVVADGAMVLLNVVIQMVKMKSASV